MTEMGILRCNLLVGNRGRLEVLLKDCGVDIMNSDDHRTSQKGRQ